MRGLDHCPTEIWSEHCSGGDGDGDGDGGDAEKVNSSICALEG